MADALADMVERAVELRVAERRAEDSDRGLAEIWDMPGIADKIRSAHRSEIEANLTAAGVPDLLAEMDRLSRALNGALVERDDARAVGVPLTVEVRRLRKALERIATVPTLGQSLARALDRHILIAREALAGQEAEHG